MGTELKERETGRTLWGMAEATKYVARWRLSGFDALALTEEERAGRSDRIVPGRLLRAPGWMPLMGGVEPYTRLARGLRAAVVHRAAIAEFGYDWRLPVASNAPRLAEAVERHLAAWRAHPACRQAQATAPDGRPPQAVLVAHSMGGLVAAAMALIPGAADQVRAVVTVGTPFHGAVKALEILGSGRGVLELPPENLRRVARTLPGLHDLLPSYRCHDNGTDVVALTPGDVASVGGDSELARDAFALHTRLDAAVLPGHRLIEGTAQHTAQTVRLRDGVVEACFAGYDRHADGDLLRDVIGRPIEIDHGGDGTVYRYSTTHGDVEPVAVAQQHAALAVTSAVVDLVRGVLTSGGRRGARLGGTNVGLDTPDGVAVGTPFDVVVRTEQDPDRVSCVVEDAFDEEPGGPVARPLLLPGLDGGGLLSARVVLERPGLYRVLVGAGGDPVSRLVMVA